MTVLYEHDPARAPFWSRPREHWNQIRLVRQWWRAANELPAEQRQAKAEPQPEPKS